MSQSRANRAASILSLCEFAARGVPVDTHDLNSQFIQEISADFERFAGQLRYMKSAAPAQWTTGFRAVMEKSHSMRVTRVDPTKKKRVRPLSKCMACGREERNCSFAIDLAGRTDPNRWLKSPEGVCEQYSEFKTDYDSFFDGSAMDHATKDGKLPSEDNGCYMVGETCLRKAKLSFLVNTMVQDECYARGCDLEDICEDVATLSSSLTYTVDNKTAANFVARKDALELAIADEKRFVPDIQTDDNFWDVIDECRAHVAKNDVDEYDRLVRERAEQRMQSEMHTKHRDHKGQGEEEDALSGAEQDDEESDDGRPHKRQRRRVICEDESDMSDQDEEGVDGQGGLDDGAPSGFASSSSGIIGVAALQRAAGILPSRRKALLQLMELQTKLEREKRFRNAAVCTNAILTLQELLQRVEELSHTV